MKGLILLPIIGLLALAAVGLAACGGGSGTSSLDAGAVRAQTGLSAPLETVEAQWSRSASILSRADSLVMSSVSGETSHSELPTYRLRARCSGTRCTFTAPRTGISQTIYLSDFEVVSLPTQAIGSLHGITLFSGAGENMGSDLSTLGAWMNHSAFAVQTHRRTVDGIRVDTRYGQAGGDLTGNRPGSATWLGLMVGTPATGNHRGDRLQGVAALNYNLGINELDVAFSSIENLDRGTAHSTRTVQFEGLHIASGGTFAAGLTGNRIQGAFYGPAHVEAAGVFEQANIVGAFGAKRQ